MSFHLPHHRPRRSRHGVITPSGEAVVAPHPTRAAEAVDAYFRSLRPPAPEPEAAPVPAVDPAHVPTGPERRAALAVRVPQRPAGPPRTGNGIRIVSSFFDDPAFAQPLAAFMDRVHRRSREMVRRFDENAARIEAQHQLGEHFAAARRDGASLAAQYHQGGTETMADLVAQVRARIVADALSGGTR